MRIPVIAGNWKMNLDRSAAVALARELRDHAASSSAAVGGASGGGAARVEIGVAPPFPYLEAVRSLLRGTPIWVAGQNVSHEKLGAFTGEVAASMLVDVGCSHVLVGHSERRHLYGESSDLVGRKLAAALAAGLAPLLCVGETLAERQAGKTNAVVLEQLESGLKGQEEASLGRLLIAYEPVWAIGTGVNATPAQAGEVHRLIREWLGRRFSKAFAAATRILYGGSVKAENAAELLAVDDVDGALVGGASLTAASFLKIVAACPTRAR
ncbi:MAG: triose-phosphate isomerase [Planctomycetes bacterium]|nr:triose-phosphate isomerase [Planctomycetota bacterium]